MCRSPLAYGGPSWSVQGSCWGRGAGSQEGGHRETRRTGGGGGAVQRAALGGVSRGRQQAEQQAGQAGRRQASSAPQRAAAGTAAIAAARAASRGGAPPHPGVGRREALVHAARLPVALDLRLARGAVGAQAEVGHGRAHGRGVGACPTLLMVVAAIWRRAERAFDVRCVGSRRKLGSGAEHAKPHVETQRRLSLSQSSSRAALTPRL